MIACLLAGMHMASPDPKRLLLVGFDKAGAELFRGFSARLHPLTTLTALEPSQLLESLGEDILFDLAILREGGLQSPEQALEKLNGLCRPSAPVLLSGKEDRLLSLLFSLNFGEPEEFLMREGFILAAFPQA